MGKNRLDRERRHAEFRLRAGRLIEARAGLFRLENHATAVKLKFVAIENVVEQDQLLL